MTTLTRSIKHLSEKPWSDYTSADYSIEQWHNACLIHQHDGAPTSKGQCKLPVKTPNGVVNRNAVHSAAAALAGARGGVHASSDEKATAAKSLIRLYHQMDEEPPPSLMRHSSVEDFIEHHGVKGMKWGRRKQRDVRLSTESKKVAETLRKSKQHSVKSLTNRQLQEANKRSELEGKFVRNLPKSSIAKGHDFLKAALAVGITVNSVLAFANSPAGKHIAKMMTKNKSKQLKLF